MHSMTVGTFLCAKSYTAGFKRARGQVRSVRTDIR
jgi:hypothetical protein